MMQKYDCIIVGAGLSGLYCAYKLVQKNYGKILILEKNNFFGGRIQTTTIDDTQIELGAGVINGNHKNTLNLLDELNLTSKLIPISSPKKMIFNNNTYDTTNLNKLFNDVIDGIKNKLLDNDFYNMAQSLSLFDLIKMCYNKQIAKLMMYKFGYHADFTDQNAVDGIKMFEKDYGPNKFYNLKGGLSQIIDKLYQFIKKHNVDIITGVQLLDIEKVGNNYICKTKIYDYQCKNLIMAIPKTNLMDIPFLNNIHYLLNSVQQISHIRIYVTYPIINGNVWFKNLPSYSTNGLINNIIPINVDKGIIMYYCDTKNAKFWHKLEKIKKLDNILHQVIVGMFDQYVPNHINITTSYKKIGTHVWKPTYDSNKLCEQIIKPYDDENIFIVGESYSDNQQWMVGAINSVDYLLSKNYIV